MLSAALVLLTLTANVGAQSQCGTAWRRCCTNQVCTASNYICQRAKCRPCGAWMFGPCCEGDTCPQDINGISAVCNASRCVPCGQNSRQPECQSASQDPGSPDGSPASVPGQVLVPIEIEAESAIEVPETRDLFFNYAPAPPSFNPQKMQAPAVVEEEVNEEEDDEYRKPLPVDSTGASQFRDSDRPRDLPYDKWKYPIDELIGKSLFFYEAQRSGVLPPDNRVSWRGDSPQVPFADGDFGGGWYDAGDHVKFHLPMTYSASRLAMSALSFASALENTFFDGRSNMYWMQRELKWIFEYILRCHPDPKTFVAQVGNGDIDHAYLGRAETMTTERPTYILTSKDPGPDLTASAAGTMALCYMIFQHVDDGLATQCRQAAKTLYDLTLMNKDALQSGVTYDITVENARKFYTSSDLHHHIFFASSMMFLATGEEKFKQHAHDYAFLPDTRALYGPHKFYSIWPSWDNGWFETAALMISYKQDTDDGQMENHLRSMLDSWIEGKGGIKITPKGGRWLSPWGSNRYMANAAGIAMLAAEALPDAKERYQCFAVSQLHYLWGDTGRSFVVGAGVNPPVKPHHRNSICTIAESMNNNCNVAWGLDRPNPNVLHGALIGGPGKPDDNYVDDRNDYVMSEVATDYNALYTVASVGAAGLDSAFWSGYKSACPKVVPQYVF